MRVTYPRRQSDLPCLRANGVSGGFRPVAVLLGVVPRLAAIHGAVQAAASDPPTPTPSATATARAIRLGSGPHFFLDEGPACTNPARRFKYGWHHGTGLRVAGPEGGSYQTPLLILAADPRAMTLNVDGRAGEVRV